MDSNFIELYIVIIKNFYTIKLTCNRGVLCIMVNLWVIINELVKSVITRIVKSCCFISGALYPAYLAKETKIPAYQCRLVIGIKLTYSSLVF
jgi:hypothetical protein